MKRPANLFHTRILLKIMGVRSCAIEKQTVLIKMKTKTTLRAL